ncbi:NAD(P)H-dependent glycerol-3-phosphate dehydrogenase [Marinomonas mediterranea]|jgi:glycerol 3-phosphate dehydrogenase (NAD(P)+) (EC 1.1.1.94)|uniref:Glycerol-3-phosphate dehydrogenase [NAD(P)+] n=1 Tax=Marinomonas mediterranea (strain ATCC 700492 / JCM 21426 / NBRC 103028 / MMB-1) TaxID=717774 RepID=F2JTH3_MARM1|nr:NAD(P)H-dependent glycerol-3-phosphate dehydrogenase [Marinomonas mediterranea]ADZ91487.1 Glycerol-3-phosphate dehydrogenase (NAD(P)+) [Marinomonas mediterranea MMB-1]WCN09454.1 NAD(P)H-dependent glycerol-3-phosphate dehydrogenase [Marinomonas mediterranea]WCN13530.1 NAD(P)H-dependent glycerol-3-phosphate dehydrogenase [Marinomonas mediterranea]WCN17596.1 NAD(P)H-dependent glycerol-3-phosphate dehydrogenase [Marinomonas mediterranea MMB-1]
MKKQSVCVLGGGSFGTAMANIMAQNGHQVSQWMRNEQQVEEINLTGLNSRYLPNAPLHQELLATNNLEEAIRASDTIFVSIPSKSFEDVVERIDRLLTPEKLLISTTKGFNPKRFELMSDILKRNSATQKIGVLSGPNLAKEIAAGQLTGSVIASDHAELRETVIELLKSPTFRVYENTDIAGVELAGALKNIYAIVCGLAKALKVGENTMAMIMTRSLAEMSRFAVHFGANPMTFLGLAGMGDLIATCTSPLSRNYRVGHALGSGQTLDDAIEAIGEVAEGVNTLRMVREEASKHGLYMPLAEGLYQLIFEGAKLETLIGTMMTGGQKWDVEFATYEK